MKEIEYLPADRPGRPVDERLHPTEHEITIAKRYAEEYVRHLGLDDPTLKDEHGRMLSQGRLRDNIVGIVLAVIEAHKRRDIG